MIHKDDYIVVHDPDLKAVYLGVCMEDVKRDYYLNPLTRVVRILRYPTQRAVIWDNASCDNAPYLLDEQARLSFCFTPCQPLIDHYLAMTWEESLEKAHHAAVTAALVLEDKPTLDILQRHKSGEYTRKSNYAKRRRQ